MAEAKISNKEEARLAAEQHPEDQADAIPGPPDGGYGWVVVFASFMCNMVVDGVSYCFGICISELILYYGETKATTALVGSILTGTTMCVGPLVSAFANKFGCRIACIAGSVVGAAAFALSVLCPSVTLLMFVYGFMGGIGFGLIYLPAVVCVGYYFESKRSLATGISVCGSGFGAFVFAPLATFLIKNYGWKGTNLCFAAITLCCAIFGALMKPLEIVETVTEVTPAITKSSSKAAIPRSNTSEGPLGKTAIYNSTLSVGVRSNVVQPLARKDIFYSGSVTNLKEFQSQATLNSYRQSVLNISRPYTKNSCLPESLGSTLSQLLDFSLLKDPVFMAIGISNIFGMGALYIPFVYLVDSAKAEGIEAESASFLISLIGILNTVGRIIFGYIADSPKVDSFLVNNMCLILAAISVALTPFCHTYTTYLVAASGFAIAISGYISLTSIILVELLGLDKLTNAFGLMILFRGFAAFIGSPMGGALNDATKSYSLSFFVAGGMFAVSAVISFVAPRFKRRKTVDNDEALTPMNA